MYICICAYVYIYYVNLFAGYSQLYTYVLCDSLVCVCVCACMSTRTCLCVCVCVCVCLSIWVCGYEYNHLVKSDSLIRSTRAGVVSCLTWVLGTEFGSSVNVVYSLNHWAIFPTSSVRFWRTGGALFEKYAQAGQWWRTQISEFEASLVYSLCRSGWP